MTKWDALLVNAVGALLLDVYFVPSQRELDLEMIRLAAPQVSGGDHRMARLGRHAAELVGRAADRGSREWRAARTAAEAAVVEIMRWRAAQLHDQLTGGNG